MVVLRKIDIKRNALINDLSMLNKRNLNNGAIGTIYINIGVFGLAKPKVLVD